MQEYKWGWDFLVYLFGILFLLLGFYSIFNIIRLWRINHLISRNYFVTLNDLGSTVGSDSGSEVVSGSDLGSDVVSGSDLGSTVGSDSGSEVVSGSDLGSDVVSGSDLGS
jgi:hypothetical protein